MTPRAFLENRCHPASTAPQFTTLSYVCPCGCHYRRRLDPNVSIMAHCPECGEDNVCTS